MSKNHSVYCPNCHMLLLKARVFYGEVKCHKCKQLVNLQFVSASGWDEILTQSVKDTNIKLETSKEVSRTQR